MYQQGELQITLDGEGVVDTENGYRASRVPCVHLPHSCDQWVIGGPEQIRALIADLRAALQAMGEPAD